MNQLEKALEKWGIKVCTECRALIKSGETSQDFYVFQTATPKESPDLLFVGINPGGNKSYDEQVSQHRGGKDRETLSDIAQGYNIYRDFENNRSQASALSRIASLTPFIQEDKVIGINVCYFNSTQANDLSPKIFNFCAELTKELLDILQPKKIIFLTTAADTLKKVGVQKVKSVGAYVKEGDWQGRKVLALPNHGFYRAYSYENASKISDILKEYLP